MKKQLLVAIYGHPEYYPPTLNALDQLAKGFEKIALVFRPLVPAAWEYPKNVRLLPSGAVLTVQEQAQLPLHRKIGLFARFILDLIKTCRRAKPEVVLLYDPMALFAFFVARKFLNDTPKIWYHNHDILEPNQRPYSLQWFALKAERAMFTHLDVFSLPADERKHYFPMEKFKGNYFLLPNFPAVSLYSRFFETKKTNAALRLIYQGQIAEGHGVEEVVRMMPFELNGKPVHLVLKGWLNPDFEKRLMPLIAERGLQNSVEFVGYTAYQELPKLTASCHVGIAIHTKNDIMNKTLGTASNKIYEYAASGLPVLYFDNDHFREHLGQYDWAFPTDVSERSLKDCLQRIADAFEALSMAARQDFLTALNFEVHFQKVAKHLDLPIEAPRFSLSTQMHSI